jgi:hypothetical protein
VHCASATFVEDEDDPAADNELLDACLATIEELRLTEALDVALVARDEDDAFTDAFEEVARRTCLREVGFPIGPQRTWSSGIGLFAATRTAAARIVATAKLAICILRDEAVPLKRCSSDTKQPSNGRELKMDVERRKGTNNWENR